MKARDPQPSRRRNRRASSGRQGPRADASAPRPNDEWGLDPRSAAQPMTMQTLRGIAVSPGIAIGPVVVLDHRGHRAAAPRDRGRGGRRRSSSGSIVAWTRRGARRRPPRPRPATGSARSTPTSWRAHARMIADPTLRRDARLRVERDLVAAEHAVSEVLEGHANRLEGLDRLAPGRPRRRRPRHRAPDPRPAPGPAADPGDGRTDRADGGPGARPVAQRDGGARPRAGPGLRHRGRRPGQPHGDRRRGAGDPRRGRPGPVPRPGPELPDGHHRRRRGAGGPRPRPADPGALPPGRRRADRVVQGPGRPGRPARRDPRRNPGRALGQHRVPRRGRPPASSGAPRASGCTGPSSSTSTAERPPTEEEQFEAYAAVVRSLAGPPGDDPDPRPGRRQAGLVPERRLRRAEPGAGAAEPPAARSATRPCSGPSSARSSGPASWATSG